LECITNNYYGGGVLDISNGTLINAQQGTIEFLGVSNQYSSRLAAPLDNQGIITIDKNLIIDNASTAHTNSGTITVRNGNLTLTQTGTSPSFTNTGTFTVDSTRVLTVTGGSFDYTSGTFSLNGTLVGNNTTANITPAFANTASINLTGSILNFNSNFSNQGVLTLTNTTVNGSSSFTNQDSMDATTAIFNMDFDNAGIASFFGSVTQLFQCPL
jgi:hypothetical protein